MVERDIVLMVGISRAPVRDALLRIEAQRLVVSKPSGRYVVELSAGDLRVIYQVRRVLEALAVELATRSRSPQGHAALGDTLRTVGETLAAGDRLA